MNQLILPLCDITELYQIIRGPSRKSIHRPEFKTGTCQNTPVL